MREIERIALFTDTYLPTLNGVARTLGQLVAHASNRGHEVALVSPTVSDTDAPGTVVHHQLSGVPLVEAYASPDVFVFPSDTETFGNVGLEAQLEALAQGARAGAESHGWEEVLDGLLLGYEEAIEDMPRAPIDGTREVARTERVSEARTLRSANLPHRALGTDLIGFGL